MRLIPLSLGLLTLVLAACAPAVTNQQAIATPSVETVSPSPKTTASSPSPQLAQAIKSGKFVSGEHPTKGNARIVKKNGQTFVEFDGSFKTDAGPALVVALHRSSNVLAGTKPPAYPIKSGDYVVLAPLKKTSGAQSYQIPGNINLANYQSVLVWCQQFNATFGAASLK
ncbi:MAG TPA: DM13 domain-containing protein [Leptolyngbyaceae cyanobacterium M33_DOE_097]|uniref:Electron transfer protein with DM13 domain protein n=1 Tax=Oscillatoriales cyanobacterium SpSt-418 TaxID=2282169 RepID=A0A7C3KC50_9CYAN|nr:DM13 domain-containing protein [Leptolyngbyaceae cyanobacterium M33_DOE_097]